ncbi:T9SS type A sorting domain-containing protein [Xanthomarina gelatinilytica]|uniref:T9SS type A sorting domain-containing protein n=1 Tax=Xanthomarina gelatinilytica TaxID=1137281 RepID=UPI003AA88738
MKHKLPIIITLFFSLLSHSQIVNIPDANFKNALINDMVVDMDGDRIGDIDADLNNDGEIQQSEAENPNIFGLIVPSKGISSLEGIQSFINIKTLDCGDNQLTNLDLSQNTQISRLFCFQNQLTTIDVSHLSNLFYFSCVENQLTSLDVSQNTVLAWLICRNNQITSLDLSQNINLTSLDCKNNQLTTLNIKNNNNEITNYLGTTNNPNLNCIQVDDVTYANNQTNWIKDDTSIYSSDCSNLSIIDQELSGQITIFPNPVKNVLNIESKGTINLIQIFDLNGKLVFEQKTFNSKLDLSHLNQGMYFLKISDNLNINTKLIIKE